jgi:hypothetical protein
MTRRLHGSCHCGAVRVMMEASTTPDKLQVRACQCGFCRRHGGLTVSDPDGHLHIEAAAGAVRRYRFAQMQSDYLFCEGCGAYVGALTSTDIGTLGIVNVRGVDMHDFQGREPDPMNYEAETVEQRQTRRKARWTPAEFIELRPAT